MLFRYSVLALDVTADEIRAVYTDHVSRRGLKNLVARDVFRAPITGTLALAARSHQQVALIQHQDLYLYDWPAWTRNLNSRVTPFAPIQSLAYVTGRGQLVLGLENGVLWVLRPTTGGLTWLLSAHAAAITALASHPRQPYVLSGSADGTLRLWDMATGEAVSTFTGHSAAIRVIVYSPDGEQAISTDADGLILRWDVAEQRILRQRRLANLRLTTLLWSDGGLLAGTPQGSIFLIEQNFKLIAVADMGAPVTALAVAGSDYIVAASANGDVCLWATVGF